MSEPDLNLVFALDALLSEGSVAGAARRLGLSASAMSRTLTRLRTATGDPLLVRAGRDMVLTDYAMVLRERASRLAHDARSVLQPSAATFSPATLERVFTIRANDGFVEAFGAALIAEVAAAAPRVRLRFMAKESKVSAHLREGLADLEIGVMSGMGPEVRVQRLFTDRFVGIVRDGHPLLTTGGSARTHADDSDPYDVPISRVSPEAYVSFRHVVASRRGVHDGPVDDALRTLGLVRDVVAVLPGFRAVVAICAVSDFIGLVPLSLLGVQGQAGRDEPVQRVVAFELPVQTADITVSQMWHPRQHDDPAIAWIRAVLLSVCRGFTDRHEVRAAL